MAERALTPAASCSRSTFSSEYRNLRVGAGMVHAVSHLPSDDDLATARGGDCHWPMTTRGKSPKKQESFAAGVCRGIRRIARTAREVARM